jgi:hypothetical protein
MKGEKELLEKLPKILGFGKLDEKTIRVEYSEGTERPPSVQSVYRNREGDPVYQINMTGASWRIEEIFEKQAISQSRGKTLEKAFGTLMMNFAGNPRFRELAGKIKTGKKVLIHDPGEEDPKTIFYPAGFIFFLRFPVIGRKRVDKIKKFKGSPWPCPKFESLEQGTILVLNEDNELFQRTVPVAEFSCTLWELEESVRRIFSERLISDKESGDVWLQVLMGADQVPGAFGINYCFEGDRILFFSLLLKREGDIPSETLMSYLRQHLTMYKEVRNSQH